MVHNPGGDWNPGWGVDLSYFTKSRTGWKGSDVVYLIHLCGTFFQQENGLLGCTHLLVFVLWSPAKFLSATCSPQIF